jgi:Domain of unknown function (DUF4331)
MISPTRWFRLFVPLVFAALAACQDGGGPGIATGPSFNVTATGARVFTQRDRLGNPLVSEVMIRKARHHQHNAGMPSTDVANFRDDLTGFMTGVAGRDAAYANVIAGALLPDMLITYPKRDGKPVFWLSWVFGGFGGRSLPDDVVDIGLGALFGDLLGNTNNVTPGLTTDNVSANDKPFSGTFPYLAAPTLP